MTYGLYFLTDVALASYQNQATHLSVCQSRVGQVFVSNINIILATSIIQSLPDLITSSEVIGGYKKI